MKTVDGQFIPLAWEDGNDGREYIRGHVSANTARSVLEAEYVIDPETTITVRHIWARWECVAYNPITDGPGQVFVPHETREGRGKFTVTEVRA